jgi:PST family polysaccharide transporter
LFWFNAAIGAVATILCFASAPLFAAFYGQPEVAGLLKVLSISFVVTNLSAVHAGLLTRSMSFRLLAIVETGATLAGLIVAIVFVYSHAGIWSLVAASITNSTVSTIGIVAFSEWRPSATVAWKDIRGVLRFGAGLSGFNILNYFGRNADNILIGKYLGPYPLGVYQIAYMVMLYPLQNVTALLGRVLFPALSEMQDDNPRFRKAYIRANCAIAFVAFPMLAGIAAVAEPFVTVWLGAKWLAAAPLLQLLAPVGLMQSVGATTGQVYTAKGRAGLLFKWALGAAPIMTLGFAIGLRWGLQGVVVSYLITNTLLTYPLFRIPFSLIDLPIWVFVKALIPYGLVTGAMYVVVVILKHWLVARGIQPLPVLLVTVGTGAVFYLGLGWLARLSAFSEIAETLGLSFLHRKA